MKNTLLLLFTFFLLHNLSAQEWEAQAEGILPLDYGVFGISVVDDQVVWAVAFDRTQGNSISSTHIPKVIKTLDGGASWEVYDLTAAVGRINFDIQALDANTAYVTTQDNGSGAGRGLFKTSDGGTTWENNFNGLAGGVWVRFFNEQEGIIINRQNMSTTQDGGQTWQAVPSANIPTFQSDEFTIITSGNNSCQILDDHIWFGTSKGRIFRSKDKGQTWSAFTVFSSNNTITSIAFKDTLNGLAINTASSTGFSRTTDGGETWSNATSHLGVSISNIEYIPNTAGSFVGVSVFFNNPRKSVYSTDFGESWETITTNIPYNSIDFSAANVGWASRSRMFGTNDPAMYKWKDDFFVNTDESVAPPIEMRVFPNPFMDQLNISLLTKWEGQVRSLQLRNTQGQLVSSSLITNHNNWQINTKSLPTGTYFLQLQTGQTSFLQTVIRQ
jgi:photosystem II stability/assembly factor-like uncharacterized protein